jgi:hypothetical protein
VTISDSRYWNTEQITECSTGHLLSALQELFLEPVSSVIEREKSMLDRLLAECGNRCVLFGAGNRVCGRVIAALPARPRSGERTA